MALNHQSNIATDLLEQAFQAIRAYQRDLPNKRAYPTADDLRALSQLDAPLSSTPSKPADVLSDLIDLGAKTAVPTTGGRFFGFVSGGVLPIALAARLVADSWDQGSALHVMSPLAASIEQQCEKWMIELLGLPEQTVAGFVSGTSMATLCAFAAARLHLLKNSGWDADSDGLFGAPTLRVIAPENAHSCVERALRLLGFGKRNVQYIPTDFNGRIDPNTILDLDDRTLLVLQAGDVNTGGFDRFEEICVKANDAGAWVHIDGAFGLWAAASENKKALTQGIQNADSWACDAHKTLNAPYECGVVLCKHPEIYRSAMKTGASYAVITEQRNGMALVPEMSRRARAIEVWAILKSLGKAGVQELVDQLCERATLMASLLKQSGVPILNDVVFNQVLISGRSSSQTSSMLKFIQNSGVCWCGGSTWKGQDVIRISISAWETTEQHIRESAHTITTAFHQST